MIQADQWSISSSLHEHRPMYRVALNDALGTQLYISSSTGQVVRDTRRTERLLNYFAAVTHWLYPTFLRRHTQLWSWTVDILAGVATVLAISGLWLGITRWRRSPGRSISPYRGLMRWHHVTGLVFGLTTLTWVFSGLLSMNPGGLNSEEAASEEEALVFAGTPLIPGDFAGLQTSGSSEFVDVELLHYDRQPFFRITDRSGEVMLQYAGSEAAGRAPNVDALLMRAPHLLPDATLVRSKILREFDEYYYTRHQASGEVPLPALLVQFDDGEHTRFYVDVATGKIQARSTQRNRAYRWLYNGLHSFDFQWLRVRRPLWDLVVITFCLGGLCLSIIGLIAAIRRLRREMDGLWSRPGSLATHS
jgi:uncharacterized iron-regulated membrane protein